MGIERAQALWNHLGWTARVRPMVVGAFIADFLAPERRTIIETNTGLKFFADPLSNFGESLIKERQYEAETEQIVREHLFEGANFLDVGANEGYFSVVASSIVGSRGYVASVEPQPRLCEMIQINLALNRGVGDIFNAALGGVKGDICKLHLYPSLNTGAASMVRSGRFYRRVECVSFVDPLDILGERDCFAFVKVDVEGFEGQVVKSLLPLLQAGRIRTLLLDYHASILHTNGTDPKMIEKMILESGMSLMGNTAEYSGYRLYTWK